MTVNGSLLSLTIREKIHYKYIIQTAVRIAKVY
ncbi:unnamed protein product, partial [marine sediment metagenome]